MVCNIGRKEEVLNPLSALFGFSLVIAAMLLGGDLITRSTPAVNRQYRRVLRAAYGGIRRHASRLTRWAWRQYKQFILGTAFGILATLYFTGHFR